MSDRRRTPSLRTNILSNFIGQALLMVLSLVSTYLVFRRLGPEILGVIYFATTVTFVFNILSDVGLSYTVTREIAAFRGSRAGYVEDLIGSMSVLVWLAYGVSCLIVIGFASYLINHWLKIDSADSAEVTLAFQVISASLLVSIPRMIYGAVLSGYERMDLMNLANVGNAGITQLGLILVLAMGGSLYYVAAWYALSALIGIAIFMALAGRLAGFHALRLKFRTAVIRDNVRFGSMLFVNSMVGYLLYQIDRWVISRLLPVSQLGYYGVAQGFASKASMVSGAIATAAFPTLSRGVTNQARSGWVGQYHKLQDLTTYVLVPLCAAVAMLGIVVMEIVFSHEVMKAAWLPLIFLSLGQLLLGFQYVPYMLSLAMKRPEMSLYPSLTALVVVVPGAILLTMNFGLSGAALTMALASFVHMMFFLPRFSAGCLETGTLQWYRTSGAYVGIGLLAYGLPWATLGVLGQGLNIYGLSVSYVAGTLVYLYAGWLITGRGLRDAIVHHLHSLRLRHA